MSDIYNLANLVRRCAPRRPLVTYRSRLHVRGIPILARRSTHSCGNFIANVGHAKGDDGANFPEHARATAVFANQGEGKTGASSTTRFVTQQPACVSLCRRVTIRHLIGHPTAAFENDWYRRSGRSDETQRRVSTGWKTQHEGYSS